MRAATALLSLALLPVLIWPGLEQPFSLPKTMLVAAAAVLMTLLPAPLPWRGVPAPLTWVTLAWAGIVALSALTAPLPAFLPVVLALAAPLFAAGIVRHASPAAIVRAQAAGATVCGVVAVLQWGGVDPITWVGWTAPVDGASVRMRVYATLGNPNFVGVLMAMSLPLTAAAHRRTTGVAEARLWEAALAIQAAALVATGSRGAVLGLVAAIATYAALRWSHRVRLSLGVVLAIAALVLAVSPARSIDTTAAGRLHLWRIAAPHAAERPVLGLGPGSVPLRFPDWQREAARAGIRDPRFAGQTDHVHNDYLEILIERGVPGLLTLLAPIAVVLVCVVLAARPVSSLLAGAAAAVAAGAACALVDFPLARPTELAWWWVSCALVIFEYRDTYQRQ